MDLQETFTEIAVIAMRKHFINLPKSVCLILCICFSISALKAQFHREPTTYVDFLWALTSIIVI